MKATEYFHYCAVTKKLQMRFLCFFIIIFFGSFAFGDGCYIPLRAIRKIPEISAQRAVLAWKDGKETLVISSALDSESQKLGWIIPLPAVPESIEKQSPGALKTLNFCIQPKITHDLHRETIAISLAVILANLVLGTILFKSEHLLKLLLILLTMCILWSLLLPAAGVSSRAAVRSDTLSVEKTVAVGSYDISILKASQLADLNRWLSENDFSSLPPAADKIVEGYLSKGWVFAAIKLVRGESGANAPHPIQMQFPSIEAVYPLKLTSIAGSSPEFEIFVIADQKASCDALSEEFCDRFAIQNIDRGNYSDDNAIFTSECETRTEFAGVASNLIIGHSGIQQLMWDNCVLTKFAGSIPAEKMEKDLNFAWVPFKAYRQQLYTTEGASSVSLIGFIFAAGVWLFVSMIIFKKKIRTPSGPLWYFGVVLVPVFVIFALTVMVGYWKMPKLAAAEVQISHGRHHLPPILFDDVRELLDERPELFKGSVQDLADAIFKLKTTDRFTGRELKQEDSPGNFTIDKVDNQIVIRIYDYYGGVLAIKSPKSEKSDANR